ncbi:RsmB/NOP family class I SAM-dependent RNA methyltransferase [Lacticaseibacillus jixianensis]|uniref:RsmB/NOP family class I SAM-dependent RNA methyltransferase n=1 Tax=Lacticaseibacillus jixianensis TaxID=2486012 RepID=A0ABW4BCB6_9LACO|nr:RsmF rRNA methyltransferase first C-terminal domain-containing protein [Lacticaseibacillus jixianensis]
MTLPAGFITKYETLLKADAAAFLATFDASAAAGFRTNPLHEATAAAPAIPWSQWGHYGKVAGASLAHVAGDVYSQEPSAQFVGTVAAPKPGERVLDLCAAPGGKSTHLGSYMQQQGLLVANEINPGRARVLSSNLERFGLTNALVTNTDPAHLAALLPEFFDRILVDAPCSGEGMFRKDPDAMSYWTPSYSASCAERQREILTEAVKMLRPGGVLVYSTCTFAPEEDEQIVAWATQHLALSVLPIEKVAGIADGRPDWANGDLALAGTARLWPHQVAGEGHFVSKLQKAGSAAAARPRAVAPVRLNREQQRDFAAFEQASLAAPLNLPLTLNRDVLATLPTDTPALPGIHILRTGLTLGTFKRGRFEPAHALATALAPAAFKTVVAVSEDEFARYRHGETLSRPALTSKQTVLLTYQGRGFALGKAVSGTIKNAYPKGLRI